VWDEVPVSHDGTFTLPEGAAEVEAFTPRYDRALPAHALLRDGATARVELRFPEE
jgi:hypothetical protein